MKPRPVIRHRVLAGTARIAVTFALVFLAWLPSAALAAIASAHPLATEAGEKVLAAGGNAFDAAVAVAAALGVVEPYSSGLGGGGFFLLHRASDRFEVMVDARETAPARASPDMFLDASGKPVPRASTLGAKAAAIPGLPAALAHLAERYGRLPLTATLAPAVRLAREGFPVDARYATIARVRERALATGVNTSIFLADGKAPGAGFVLRQPDLANTLEILAREGRAGFYAGRIAQAMVGSVARHGGLWELSDLAAYRVIERAPQKIAHRGATITTASLPSSGGLTLAQALNILARFPPGSPRDPEYAHLAIEALRLAFQDRALYLGDADFVEVPAARLASPAYAERRAASIDRQRAGTGASPAAPGGSSDNTTHFSIVDAEGNRVAATVTINLLFGACFVPDGTGVLLNDEMDDFAVAPDAPNAFRLRQAQANAIAPGKRPLSSMSPTFVEDERGVLVLGAPGGSRIISMVLLAILEHLDRREVDLAALLALPRYHHQYWPDQVEVEPQGFAPDWLAALEAKGHRVSRAGRAWGNMQAVFVDRSTGRARAASDPRGGGMAWF